MSQNSRVKLHRNSLNIILTININLVTLTTNLMNNITLSLLLYPHQVSNYQLKNIRYTY